MTPMRCRDECAFRVGRLACRREVREGGTAICSILQNLALSDVFSENVSGEEVLVALLFFFFFLKKNYKR